MKNNQINQRHGCNITMRLKNENFHPCFAGIFFYISKSTRKLKVPWYDEVLRSLSINFRSMRLSSTAKTWNWESAGIPIFSLHDQLIEERVRIWFLLGWWCFFYVRRRRREELCNEIRPTNIHIPQSKIRPDFIPNLANFPTWFWITGQAMQKAK